MAEFEPAILLTIQHEGGYVNNPNDSGGATKYGITQADLDRWMPGTNVADLTIEQARELYLHKGYWNTAYELINDQDICNKLFDMGVLFGVREAVFLLQLSIGFLADKLSRVFDGPTLLGVNANGQGLLQKYKSYLARHAQNIAAANKKDEVFIKGWLNRVNS